MTTKQNKKRHTNAKIQMINAEKKNTKMQLCNTKDILPYYTNRQNYTSRQEKRQTRDFTKKKKPQLST